MIIDGVRAMDRATELLLRYYTAFNRADWDGMLALLSEDVKHDVNQGSRENGREAFRTFLARMNRCYSEQLRDIVVMANADGSRAAAEFVVHGQYLANDDGLWRPGSAVKARITVEQQPAALVVPLAALQTLEQRDVVFVREGDRYIAHPVRLGKRDARQVEVLNGLEAGDEVVVGQSYLIKADIEKAGAAHEH